MSLPLVDPRLAANSYADDPTIKKLQLDEVRKRVAGNVGKDKKLREACEGFEAVFLQKIWEQMRHNVPKEGYLHSKDEESYQSMFDVELSKKMASSGGIGLADMMYEQLNVKLGQASRATSTSMLMKDHKIKELHAEKDGMPLKDNYGKLKVEGNPFAEQMGKKAPSRPVNGASGTPNELSAGLYEDLKEDNLEGSKEASNLDVPLKDVPAAANMGTGMGAQSGEDTPQNAARNLVMSRARNSTEHQSDVIKWAQGAGATSNAGSAGPESGAAASMLATPFKAYPEGQMPGQVAGQMPGQMSGQMAGQMANGAGANARAEAVAFSNAAKATEIADGADGANTTKPQEIMMEIPGFKGMKRPFMQPFSKPASNLSAFDTVETVVPYRKDSRPDPVVQSAEQASTLRTPPVTTGLGKSPGRSSGQAPVLAPPAQRMPSAGQSLSERDLGSQGAHGIQSSGGASGASGFARSTSMGSHVNLSRAGTAGVSGNRVNAVSANNAAVSSAGNSAVRSSAAGSAGGSSTVAPGMFPTFNEVPNI